MKTKQRSIFCVTQQHSKTANTHGNSHIVSPLTPICDFTQKPNHLPLVTCNDMLQIHHPLIFHSKNVLFFLWRLLGFLFKAPPKAPL